MSETKTNDESYENGRLVSKFPDIPANYTTYTQEYISLLNDLTFNYAKENYDFVHFRKDPATGKKIVENGGISLDDKIETLFVFGNGCVPEQIADHIHIIYAEFKPKTIFLTGGRPTGQFAHLSDLSAADHVYSLVSNDVKENCNIIKNPNSTSSLEDISFMADDLKKLDKEGTNIGVVGIEWAFTRQVSYAEIFINKANIIGMPYRPTWKDGFTVSPESWPTREKEISRLFGEYERILKYGSIGDMAYPEELQEKVQKITDLKNQ